MEVLVGKSSVNGPFSIAMLNNQRVSHPDLWKLLFEHGENMVLVCFWWMFGHSCDGLRQ